MKLFHGSDIIIEKPDLLHSRPKVDFGRGFYTTPLKEQAIKWCERYKKNNKKAIVSYYEFDVTAYKAVRIMNFEEYDEKWLDFIIACRRGEDTSDYDIVSGGIANDRVFNTIELYFDNLIEKNEALKRLRYEKPNYQICFRNQEVIDKYLLFEGSEEV